MLAAFFLACGLAISSEAKELVVPKGAAAVVNGVALPERIVKAFRLNGQAALGVDEKTERCRETLAKLRQNIIDEQIERLLIAQEDEAAQDRSVQGRDRSGRSEDHHLHGG